MTETDREAIRGEDIQDDRRYQAVSRVRSRIQDELVEDVEVLRNNHPQLFAELEAVVCERE